jgi:hypothetical protein
MWTNGRALLLFGSTSLAGFVLQLVWKQGGLDVTEWQRRAKI